MIIVYTAILGTCDSLKPAPVGADKCVCLTDDPKYLSDPKGWTVAMWPNLQWEEEDPRREAWRLRCLPHELFPDHDTSVWIDASFTLTDLPKLLKDAHGYELSTLEHTKRHSCYEEGAELVRIGQSDRQDVAEQLRDYRAAQFHPFSLPISGILVRANTLKVRTFNLAWEQDIRRYPGDNTQLSLGYCAWKAGLVIHTLTGERKGNPYAQHDHLDHRRKRQPYRKVVRA